MLPCDCARAHIADGTFAELAGIDPTDWRAAAAKLPPVDSHSLVPVLMGTGISTRKEIPIGTEPRLMTLYNHTNQVSTIQAVIQEDETGKLWKLIIGMNEQAGWQGIHYPNHTTNTCCFGGPKNDPEAACPARDPCPPMGEADCLNGCLYEVCSAASAVLSCIKLRSSF